MIIVFGFGEVVFVIGIDKEVEVIFYCFMVMGDEGGMEMSFGFEDFGLFFWGYFVVGWMGIVEDDCGFGFADVIEPKFA